MTTLYISKAKEEFYKLTDSCIKYNEIIKINTKEGNVIMLSEENYNSLIESLYLARSQGVYEDIKETVNTPTEELSKDLIV